VSNGFNAVKSVATNVWNGIKSAIQNVWNGIKSMISGAVSSVKSTISSAWSGLQNILTAPFEAAKKTIEKIIGGIKSVAGGIKKAIGGLFSTENPEFVTPVVTAPSAVSASVPSMSAMGGGILDSVMGMADFSSDLYGSKGNANIMGSAASTKADTMLLVKGLQSQNTNLETQNNLLMQMVSMLSAGQQIAVNVDGREVARATSSYMDNALRKNRDSKSRARGGK
jgi:phage-related protein